MCGLCGALGVGDHWSSGAGSAALLAPAAERYRQAEAANRVLGLYGLRLKVWADRYTLHGRTGRSVVVGHMGELWPLAETLAGTAIDPLDASVMLAMEGGR
jgi:hypothetical protein